MALRSLLTAACAAVLAAACGAADSAEAGVSAVASELTVGGCQCVASGSCAQLSYADVPADGKYVITTFGGGSDTQPMSCGGTADGSWAYVADRARFPCGTKLLVEAKGKHCVAQVADCGPNRCVEQAASGSCGSHFPVLDASPLITKHLLGFGQTGWSDGIVVVAKPIDASSVVGCPGVPVSAPASEPPACTPPSCSACGDCVAQCTCQGGDPASCSAACAPGSGGAAGAAGSAGAAGAGGSTDPGKADDGDNGVDGVGSCSAPACDGCTTCLDQCLCAGTDPSVCAGLCDEGDGPGGSCQGDCLAQCACQGFDQAYCAGVCGSPITQVVGASEQDDAQNACAASIVGAGGRKADAVLLWALVALGAALARRERARLSAAPSPPRTPRS